MEGAKSYFAASFPRLRQSCGQTLTASQSVPPSPCQLSGCRSTSQAAGRGRSVTPWRYTWIWLLCSAPTRTICMTKPSLSQAAGMIDDTTYPQTTRSSDPHRQQDLYSNKRGKDECALQGHLTCCAGHVEATRPGKLMIRVDIMVVVGFL